MTRVQWRLLTGYGQKIGGLDLLEGLLCAMLSVLPCNLVHGVVQETLKQRHGVRKRKRMPRD